MSRFASLTQPSHFGGTMSIVQFVQETAPFYDYCRAVPAIPVTAARPWTAELTLEELSKLKQNWDGYGGLPVAPEGCAHARTFVALTPQGMLVPDISPTSNGTVNLEWTSSDGEAYIEIGRTRYSGHIQPRQGETIYLQGQLTNSAEQNLATEQVLAVINELLYGASSPKSFTHSIQIPELAL